MGHRDRRSRRGRDRGGAGAAAGRAVEADGVDTNVARLVGGVVWELALDGSRTTALGVLDGVLRARFAGNDVVAGLAVVVAVDEVDVGVLVDRHLHLVHGEGLGAGTAGELGALLLGRLTLNALVRGTTVATTHTVAGQLGATQGELLAAAAEATAGGTFDVEAAIAGDGTLGHLGLGVVNARLLLVATLVAGARAGGELLAVAPVGLFIHL